MFGDAVSYAPGRYDDDDDEDNEDDDDEVSDRENEFTGRRCHSTAAFDCFSRQTQ